MSGANLVSEKLEPQMDTIPDRALAIKEESSDILTAYEEYNPDAAATKKKVVVINNSPHD